MNSVPRRSVFIKENYINDRNTKSKSGFSLVAKSFSKIMPHRKNSVCHLS